MTKEHEQVRARIAAIRQEIHGSWGKPVSWVQEREQELQTLLRREASMRAGCTRKGEEIEKP